MKNVTNDCPKLYFFHISVQFDWTSVNRSLWECKRAKRNFQSLKSSSFITLHHSYRIPLFRVNIIKFSLGVKLLAIIKSILEFFFYHNVLQFRAASIRKNNSIRKIGQQDLKMCFLVDLFFLIEFFFSY